MYVLKCNIQIGKYVFDRANSIEIERSTELLTDTCKLTVPLTALLVDVNEQATVEVAKTIKVGDAVLIDVYYDGYQAHAIPFNGYVKQINYKMPLEIECEDATYLLRAKTIKKSWQSTTLNEVLTEIISGTRLRLTGNVPVINLSPFYLKDVNGMFALQKLKDEYGLTIYVTKGNQLYCGLAYAENTGEVNYVLNGDDSNVANADDLTYHSAEDMKLKVKAIAVSGNNTRTEVEVGDDDGAVRTLYFYNVPDMSTLTKMANQEIIRLKFDGYEGKLTTMLIPYVVPGMKANITDERFSERSGSYFVESVKTTWGMGGARNEVEVSIKL